MKERNLHTLLDGFQKVELEDLGNILGNELSPRLRKSQLVEQLHTYLHAQPRRWMSHLMERDVRLPKGTWRDEQGKKYKGGKTYRISVPLERLPYFELIK